MIYNVQIIQRNIFGAFTAAGTTDMSSVNLEVYSALASETTPLVGNVISDEKTTLRLKQKMRK